MTKNTLISRFIAGSEIPASQRNRFGGSMGLRRRLLTSAAGLLPVGGVLLSSLLAVGVAHANPQGGTVVAGSASIVAASPDTLNVLQSSNKAIINWQSFNIQAGETVNFIQPSASSMTLNRVTGMDPSAIFGSLNANGTVVLVNPNGVVFGPTSRVDVGGLVATTANIRDADFMAGNMNFDQASLNKSATVVNQGEISIKDAGLAALVAPGVENSGVINARLGKVALGGAQTFTLDFHGDGLLSFGAGSLVDTLPQGVDGAPMQALVVNTGQISAEGGVVQLSARAVKGVVDNVINTSGVIAAKSVSGSNGKIVLGGGDSGTVAVAGTLDASGTESGQTGGSVVVTGESVTVAANAVLDVSGDLGGGVIAVGSDGTSGAAWAKNSVKVAKGAKLKADAITNGKGGTVTVLADKSTSFAGSISAKGGAQSGDGGFAEVSSRNTIAMTGTVDLTAAKGKTGTFLLDPATLKIVAAAGGTQNTAATDGSVAAADADSGANTISVSVLQALNATTNIVLEATGLITVDTSIALQTGSGNSFTLRSTGTGADAGITFTNATDTISTQGGAIVLEALVSGSTLKNIGNLTSNGGAITLKAGGFIQIAGNITAGAGAITVDSSAGSITAASTSKLAGASVTLSALGGHVGASGAAIAINSGVLTLETGGNAYVANERSLTSLTFKSTHALSSDSNIYSLSATDLTFSMTDSASALTVDNVTSSGMAFSLTSDYALTVGTINVGTAALSLTSEYGSITKTASNHLITGGALSLIARGTTGINGAIGATGAALETAVSSLTAIAGSGIVSINNTGALALTSLTSAGSATIEATGTITVGAVALVPSSGSSTLSLTSTAGSIVDDASSVTLIKANNLYMAAAGAIGASGAAISSSNATTINATASAGGVFVSTGGSVTFQSVQANNGDISLTATGAATMTVTSVAVASGSGNITLNAGGVLTYGNINAGTGNVTLTAGGTGIVNASSGPQLITGNVLTATGTGASSSLTLKTLVSEVVATSGTIASITLTQASGNLLVTKLEAGSGNASVTLTTGDLTLKSLTAGEISVITAEATGGAILAAAGSSLKGGTISLKAAGSIASSATPLNTQTGVISITNTGSFYIDNSVKLLTALTIDNKHSGSTAHTLAFTSPDLVFTASDDGSMTTLTEVNSTFLTVFSFTSDKSIKLGQLDLENVANAKVTTTGGSIVDDGNTLTRIMAKALALSATGNVGGSGGAIGVNTAELSVSTAGDLSIDNIGHFNYLDIISTHADSTVNYTYSVTGQHLEFALTDSSSGYTLSRVVDSGYGSGGGLNYFGFKGDRDITLGELTTGAFDYTYTASGQSGSGTSGNSLRIQTTAGAIKDDGSNSTGLLASYINLAATKNIGAVATNEEIDIYATKGLAATAGTDSALVAGTGGIYITAQRTIGTSTSDTTLTVANADRAGSGFGTASGDVVLKLMVGDVKFSTSIGTVAGSVTIEAAAGSIYNPSQDPTIIATTKITLKASENIGSSVTDQLVKVRAGEVVAIATTGGVSIGNSGIATGGSNSATFSEVTAGGDIAIIQAAGNIVLGKIIANAGAGDIKIANTTSGKIDDDGDATTVIQGASLTLQASGAIGDTNQMRTTVSKLTIQASSTINFDNSGVLTDVTLVRGSSGSYVNLTATGQSIQMTSGSITGVSSNSTLNLSISGTSNIALSDNIGVGAAGTFSLTSTGSITRSNGTITAGEVKLTSGTTASIGTSSNSVRVASAKLTLSSGRNIYVTSSSALTHVYVTSTDTASTANTYSIAGASGGTIAITDSGTLQTVDVANGGLTDFSLINSKNININEIVATGAVVLSTTGGGVNSNITINNGASVLGSSVTLVATGTGAGNGSIGTSDSAMKTSATTLNITSNGNVYINNSSTALTGLTLVLTHKSAATSDVNTYSFASLGTNRSVTLSESGGILSVAGGATSGVMDFSLSVDRAILTKGIDAGTNTTGKITLTSTGGATGVTGTIAHDEGRLTAGEVILSTIANSGAAIGTGSSARIQVDTKKLTLATGGDYYVTNDTALTDLTLNLAFTKSSTSYARSLNSDNLTLNYSPVVNSSSVSAVELTEVTQSGLNLTVISTKTIQVTEINIGSGTAILNATGSSANVNATASSSVITAGRLEITAASVGNSQTGVDTFYGKVGQLKIIATGTVNYHNTGNLALDGVSNRGTTGGTSSTTLTVANGTLTQVSGSTAVLGGKSLELTVANGAIGTSGTPLQIDTESLTLISGSNVYFNNVDDLFTFTWTVSHNVGGTNSYALTGKNLAATISNSASTGNFVLNSLVDASGLDFTFSTGTGLQLGTVTVQNGRILNLETTGTSTNITTGDAALALTAGKVILKATGQLGVLGTAIQTKAQALVLTTTSDVHVNNSTVDLQSLSITSTQATGGTAPVFSLSGQNLTISSIIDNGTATVSMEDTTGLDFTFVTKRPIILGKVNLTKTGTATITSSDGSIVGTGVSTDILTAAKATLSGRALGGSSTQLYTATPQIALSTQGDVYIVSTSHFDKLKLTNATTSSSADRTFSIASKKLDGTDGVTIAGTYTDASSANTSTFTTISDTSGLDFELVNVGTTKLGTVDVGKANVLAITSPNGVHEIDGTSSIRAGHTTFAVTTGTTGQASGTGGGLLDITTSLLKLSGGSGAFVDLKQKTKVANFTVGGTSVLQVSSGDLELADIQDLNGSMSLNGASMTISVLSGSVLGGGVISGAGTLTISASGAVGNSLKPLVTGANNAGTTSLTITASGGGVYLSEDAALTVSSLTAAGDVVLNIGTSTAKDFTVGGAMNAGTNAVSITVAGAGSIKSTTSSSITAGSLTLVAKGGEIGASTGSDTKIKTTATKLSVNSLSNIHVISSSDLTDLTIDRTPLNSNTSNSSGTVEIGGSGLTWTASDASGVMTLTNATDSTGLNFTYAARGNLVVNTISVGSGAVVLSATQGSSTTAATITGTGTNKITAGSLTLAATTGTAAAIGTSSTSLGASVDTLTITSTGTGGAYISNDKALVLNGVASNGVVKVVTTAGDLSVNGAVTWGSSSALTLEAGGSLLNTANVTLSAGGASAAISLKAGTGIGTAANPFQIAASNSGAGSTVSATTTGTGSVYLNTGSITGGLTTSVKNGLTLINASGAVLVSSMQTTDDAAGNDIIVTVASGDLTIGKSSAAGSIAGSLGSSRVVLTAVSGGVLQGHTDSSITGREVGLRTSSGIGSSSAALGVSTRRLAVRNTTANAGAYVNATGAELGVAVLSTNNGVITITGSTNTIASLGLLSSLATSQATAGAISVTLGTDSIAYLGDIRANGTTQAAITLNVGAMYDDGISTTRVSGGSLSITGATAFGTLANPIQVTTATVTGGLSGTGSLYIDNNLSTAFTLGSSGTALSVANGALVVTAAGAVSVVNVTQGTDGTDKDVKISTTSGDITVTKLYAGTTSSSGTPASSAAIVAAAGAIATSGTDTHIIAGKLSLTATGGNIGTVTDAATGDGSPVKVKVDSITLLSAATASSVLSISNIGTTAVTLGNSAVVLGTGASAYIKTAGSLDVSAGLSVSSGNLLLEATTLTLPSTGILSITGALTLKGSTDVVASGGGRALTITASSLTFSSGASGGNVSLTTTTGALSASLTGTDKNLTVSNTGTLSSLSLAATGNITFTNSVGFTAGSVVATGASRIVTLTATAGDMTLSTINAGATGTLTLSASAGSVLSATGGATLTGTTLNLTTATGVGTSSAAFNTTFTNLSATVTGTGGIYISGSSFALGNLVTANGDIEVTTTGNITDANASTGFTAGGSGNVKLKSTGGTVTLTNSYTTAGTDTTKSGFSVEGTSISLQGVTTTGAQSYIGAVTANASLTGKSITVTGGLTLATGATLALSTAAANGNIAITGTITGASKGLILSAGTGSVTVGGAASGLSALAIAGGTISVGDVTSTGTQSYTGATTLSGTYTTTNSAITVTGAVTLAGTTTLSAGSGTLTLSSTVDGAHALTLNSTGATTVSGAIGGTTALASLTSNSGGTSSFKSVTTTGTQTYNDAVTLNGTYSTTDSNFIAVSAATLAGAVTINTGSGAPEFSDAIDGAFALVVNSTSVTTFGGPIGLTTALASLTTDAGGSTIIFGATTTTGAQSYGDNLSLNSAVLTTSNGAWTAGGTTNLGSNSTINTGSGAVTFTGTVDGAKTLTINSTGATTFSAAVGGTTALTSLTTNAGGTVSLVSVTTSAAQSYGENATLNGTYTTNNGTLSVGGTTTLAGATTVSTGSGAVTFTGAVNGAQALVVNSTGATLFSAAIGGTTALTSLTTNAGGTSSFQSVTTSGAQTYNDAVTLTGTYTTTNSAFTAGSTTTLAGTTVVDTGSAAITFTGTVNGAQALTVRSTGTMTFSANVGSSTALASLTTNTGGTVILQNVTTSGSQTYNDNVVLNGVYVATTGDFIVNGTVTLGGISTDNRGIQAGGAITLSSTMDGATGLVLNSTGATTVGGAIGGTTALASLVSTASGGASFKSVSTTGQQFYINAVTLDGTYTTTNSKFTASSTSTLAGAVTVNTGSGAVNFNGAVNGAQALTVTSTGAVSLAAAGATSALTSVQIAGSSISLKSVTSTGAQSYTGATTIDSQLIGASVLITGNLAHVSLDSTFTINTSAANGAITITGAVSGTEKNGVLTAGTGAVSFGGAATDLTSLTITGGTISLKSVTTSGTQTYTGAVALDGTYTTSNSAFSVSGAATLASAITVSTGSGALSFGSTVDGAQALTLNSTGVTTVSGAIGGTTALTSLTSNSGGTSSFKSVTTSGAQTYNDAVTLDGAYTTTNSAVDFNSTVTLGGAATVSAGSGAVTFNDSIDGAFALLVNSTGVTTFGGPIGLTTALASLTTDAGGSTIIFGATTTTGAQSYGDDVSLNSAVLTTSNGAWTVGGTTTLGSNSTINTGSGAVTFTGAVNGAKTLTINSTGATTFSAAVGGTTALTSLTTNAGGTVSALSVTTSGAQSYGESATLNGTYTTTNSAFSVGGTTTLAGATTVSTGSGAVTFTGTVNGAQVLSVNSTGATLFSADVGGTTALTSLTTDAGGTSSFQSVTTSGAQTYNDAVTLNGTYTTSNNAFSAASTTTLAGTTVVDTGSAAITFTGTVNGAQALTVKSTGTMTFGAAVGGTTALASLTTNTNGTVVLQNVATSGAQTYNDNVVLNGTSYSTSNGAFFVSGTTALGANVTITTGSGAITLTGATDGAFSLALNSTGATTASAAIGGTTALTSLTTNAGGTASFQSVTTSGAQTYNDAVALNGTYATTNSGFTAASTSTLAGATTVTTGSGAVTFTDTVNGAQALVVNSTGATLFSADVGGTTALASLTTHVGGTSSFKSVTTSGAQTYNDTLTLDGTYTTSNNMIAVAGAAVLAGNTTLSTGSGTISFASTVDGAQSLTVNAGTGAVNFGGAVGETSRLGDVVINSTGGGTWNGAFNSATLYTATGDTLAVNGGSISTTMSQSFGNRLVLGANTTLSAVGVLLRAGADASVAGNQTLTVNAFVLYSGAAIGGQAALGGLSVSGVSYLKDAAVNTTGGQFYNGNVLYANSLTLTALDATIAFAGTVDGLAGFLVDDRVSSLSLPTIAVAYNVVDSSGIGPDLTVNAGSGDVTFAGVVGALSRVGALTINSTGATLFGDEITAASVTTNAGGTSSFKSVTTSGSQTYNDAVTLIGTYTTTNSGFTAVGTTLLAGATTVSTGSGAVSFTGTVNGAQALVVNSTGATLFSADVGGTTALTSLTTNAGGTVSVLNVTTSGAQSYGENATLNGTYTTNNNAFSVGGTTTLAGATTVSTGSGAVTFTGTVNGAQALVVNSTGATLFSADVGGTTALNSLTTNAGGTASLKSVSTSGAQSYGEDATLNGTYTTTNNAFSVGGTTTLAGATTVNTGSGAVTFTGTVNGAQALVVNSTGATRFSADVGGTTALTSLTTNVGGTVSVLNVTTSGAQSYGENATLNGTYTTTNNAFSVGGTTTLAGATTVSTGSGAVTFTGTVNGAQALVVNSTGATLFSADVGGTTALTSVTTNAGGTASFQSVTTSGAQSYGENATLNGTYTTTNNAFLVGGTTALAGAATVSTGSGAVTFTGTVNGAQALVVNSTGATLFSADVGGTTALTSLTTNAGGTSSFQSVTTSGSQTYNDAVTLIGTYTTTDSGFTAVGTTSLAGATTVSTGSGAVSFTGTVNGAQALVVNSTGATLFSADVGGTTALTSLTTNAGGTVSVLNVTTSGAQSYGENATLNGTYTTTNNAFSVGGTTTLAGASTVSTGSGAVTFTGTVNGAQALVVNSTGATLFSADVGGTTALTSLTTNAGGTASFKSVTTSGAQSYGEDATLNGTYTTTNNAFSVGGTTTLAGATTVNTGSGAVTFTGTVNGAQALSVDSAGATTFDGAISVASLVTDTAGTLAVNGGAVQTSGVQSFGERAVLGANTTFTGLTVTFNQGADATAAGGQSLTVVGNAVFGGAVGAGAAVSFVSVSGTTQLQGGSIIATGDLTFVGATNVTSAHSLSSTGGSVVFGSTLDSANRSNLSLLAASAINVAGAIGSTGVLGTLTTQAGGSITANAAVKVGSLVQSAAGGLTRFLGTLEADGSGGLQLTGNSFQFAGPVTASAGALAIANTDSAGSINFARTATVQAATGFTQTGGASFLLPASIAVTAGNINFGTSATLVETTLSETVSITTIGDIIMVGLAGLTTDLTMSSGTGKLLIGSDGGGPALQIQIRKLIVPTAGSAQLYGVVQGKSGAQAAAVITSALRSSPYFINNVPWGPTDEVSQVVSTVVVTAPVPSTPGVSSLFTGTMTSSGITPGALGVTGAAQVLTTSSSPSGIGASGQPQVLGTTSSGTTPSGIGAGNQPQVLGASGAAGASGASAGTAATVVDTTVAPSSSSGTGSAAPGSDTGSTSTGAAGAAETGSTATDGNPEEEQTVPQ